MATATNDYKVDVLIIENLSPLTTDSFSMPVSVSPPVTGSRLADSPEEGNSKENHVAMLLPEDLQGLKKQALSIRRSAGFRLLAKYSWTFRLSRNSQQTFIIPTTTDTRRMKQLAGSITIRRGRFLQVQPDLLLTVWEEPKPVYFEQAFAHIPPTAQKDSYGSLLQDNSFNAAALSPPLAATSQSAADRPLTADKQIIPSRQILPLRKEAENFHGADSQLTEKKLTSQRNNPLVKMGLSPAQFFHLNYSRQMRSNELHYFDHPKLAMLIRITR